MLTADMTKPIKQRVHRQIFIILAACIGVFLFTTLKAPGLVSAQQNSRQWSPQAQIPDYKQFTEEPPILIVDQNNTVHAFNSQPFDLNDTKSPNAIFYRQWSSGKGWSQPIDVIINPDGDNIEIMDAHLDHSGRVHLAIQMNQQDNYYSWAPLANAGRATAWSEPVSVGQQAQPVRLALPYPAAIAGDNQGNLVIVYGGYQDGVGIYATHSVDDGVSWSEPAPILITFNDQLTPGDIQVDVGQSGQVHAVWNFFDQSGFGDAGYYSKLDFERFEWSMPIELDNPGIRTPSVLTYNGDIFVTYYHDRNNGNWWRRSSDGGRTWTEPQSISTSHIGTNGWVSLVVDSNRNLHALFGQRIDDNNHGMWHSIWQGNGWTVPEAVIKGPQQSDDIGGNGFDPRSARAVIVNGNTLLATWGTDGAAGSNGAWFSYTTLNTPEQPAVPLPVPEIQPLVEPESTATVKSRASTPIPTRAVAFSGQEANIDVVSANPLMPMIISLAPVLLLFVTILAIHRWRRYGR